VLGLDRAFFAHTRHWDITYVITPPILLSSPSRPSKLCWSRPRSRLMDLLILLTEVFLIPCFQVQSLVVLLTEFSQFVDIRRAYRQSWSIVGRSATFTLLIFSSQYFELPIPVVLPLLGRYSSLQSGAYLVQISASIYDRVGRLSISYIASHF